MVCSVFVSPLTGFLGAFVVGPTAYAVGYGVSSLWDFLIGKTDLFRTSGRACDCLLAGAKLLTIHR